MEQFGISKLDLKRRNRMQVLNILKQGGPTSRIDIANKLELTRAAVTIITNEMIEQGIIVEIGEYKHVTEKAPRGRKKILIDINYHYKFALGVTIEEDIISVGLTTLAGEVLDKRNKVFDENRENTESVVEYIIKSVREILNDNCLEKTQVIGIGFGIYSNVHELLGIKTENGVTDYSDFKKAIESYTDLPLVFGNSVRGTAIANIDFLKKRYLESDNIAFLQYGHEIDFLTRHIKDPTFSFSMNTDNVNRMIVEPDSDDVCPHCGRRGCVYNEITAVAIRKKLTRVFSKDTTPYLYELTKGDSSVIKDDMILAAYKKEDKGVVKIIDRAFMLIALLMNNLYYITSPTRIIMHLFFLEKEFAFELMKKAVKEIASDEVADKLELSLVESKHRFLSGCALAVSELFFAKGGISE